MAKGPQPIVLVALAGGAFLLLTEQGQELLSRVTGRGRAPAPLPGSSQRPAPLPGGASDPYTALIQTVGGLVNNLLPDLTDRDSDVRQGLRNFDRAQRRVLSKVGLTSDPAKKEKKKKALAAAQRYRLASMELFASKVHQAASRSDVREWVIDTPESGLVVDSNYGTKQKRARISIYYKGKTAPYVLFVPTSEAGWQLAWIAEPIVRATGGWTQRGGRLAEGAPFVFYVDDEGLRLHCFSDTNPFAIRDNLPTAGQLEAIKKTPEAQASRLSNLRRKLNPSARAALDAQTANNLNPNAQR